MKTISVAFLSLFFYLGDTLGTNNVCDKIRSYNLKINNRNCRHDPNLIRNTAEIIVGFNYTLEEYSVTTKDGYILTMQRIPYNRNSKRIGQPIFLQHGAVSSSEIFVAPGKKSLAFILSDMGYDIWLGNSRGNYNSAKHVSLKITDKSYWNYTLDDMGNYDLPACIDKIVEITKRPGEIIYIGHSQGSTISFIYSILHNEHAAKNLIGLFLLGPVTYTDNLPIFGNQEIMKLLNDVYSIGLTHIGINQLINLMPTVCAANSVFITGCKMLTDVVYGPTEEYPPEQLPILFSFILQRESLKPIVQYTQIAKSKQFQAYDYGKGNFEVYKSERPPIYDFRKLKLPVFLFRGETDHLAPMNNTERTYRELQAQSKFPVKQTIVKGLNGKPYNHMNFVYADNLEKTLVEPILNYLRGISRNKQA